MTRRRKRREPNPRRDVASVEIELARLERSDIDHIAQHYDLQGEEVIQALWGPEMVQGLRSAAQWAYSSEYRSSQMFHLGGRMYEVFYHANALGIASPRDDRINTHFLIGTRVANYLHEMTLATNRWNQVLLLTQYLFKEYTFAEVRYLFPHIQSVVPPGHMLRTVQPKPATLYNSDWQPQLRDAVAIITRGLLGNPDRPVQERNIIGFKTATSQLVYVA